MSSSEEEDVEVYIYNGVDEVPMDVTHVRVEPSVTVIPENAFKGRESLVDIILPEGLITIEKEAFQSCESLERINFSSTVEEIGEQAFEGCTKLDKIILPNCLRRLGGWAFCECESLTSINIPPNLETIGQAAFLSCQNLTKVLLPEGLQEISQDAFSFCWSLESISFPSSLKVIGHGSFDGCKVLNNIQMQDAIETIGRGAFRDCNLVHFRMLPLVTEFDLYIVDDNRCLVSIELPISTRLIGCRPTSARNVSFPSECSVEDVDLLKSCTDLKMALPDDDDGTVIFNALRHRFDELPIHKICYYQSYHDTETTMQSLKREINPWTSKPPGQLNLTDKQQDCLGMTPIHILACSTKPTIQMYELLIDKYPEALIMKDKWGDIPLLYALWCNAPAEVIDLLVESYKSLHPDYEFDWSGMLQTMAKRNVPLANIQSLINTQQDSYPDQKYDMQGIVLRLAASDMSVFSRPPGTEFETFRYLLRLSITDRIDLLDITKWRVDMEKSIDFFCDETELERETQAVYDRLDMYELAKEATQVLELAMWKHKMDGSSTPRCNVKSVGQSNKRARVDTEISERQQYRINCGANVVVRNVLPYLLPKASLVGCF